MNEISCILLAAGDSSRMKGKNKLLLKVEGDSLVRKTLREINKVPFKDMIVVTGHQEEEIRSELEGLRASFAFNPDHQTGMHSSIKKGLESLSEGSDGFFICLSDQPFFQSQILEALKDASKQNRQKKIFVPVYEGKNGHPVLISTDFVEEIFKEPDGDYGLSYLLKRYPDLVETLPVKSQGILIDVDEPSDYEKIRENELISRDPVEDFYLFAAKLREEKRPYVVATVIEVIGSASARTGSKAIFSGEGKNLLGWVGGGCAERFIGEESLKALEEHRTRIILADLDDEIFGLGVACGGKMRVFLEPHYPLENVPLPYSDKLQNEVRHLAGLYGWNVKKESSSAIPETPRDLLLTMCEKIAKQRNRSGKSLRIIKEVPARFLGGKRLTSNEVTIVGRTRITEALARHFSLLKFNVRAIGPDLKTEDYPSNVQCHCLDESYQEITFRPDEIVIIASHTSQDPLLVEKALKGRASHVAMIGSYKRSIETLTHLDLMNKETELPLFVPAGLDIDARNPEEIALSVVSEVLNESLRNI